MFDNQNVILLIIVLVIVVIVGVVVVGFLLRDSGAEADESATSAEIATARSLVAFVAPLSPNQNRLI